MGFLWSNFKGDLVVSLFSYGEGYSLAECPISSKHPEECKVRQCRLYQNTISKIRGVVLWRISLSLPRPSWARRRQVGGPAVDNLHLSG